jgi:DNA-binding MarR family transcriptional regulator
MNPINMLHQKEVSLLEALHKSPSASQRLLSTNLQMSLGQINTLIKSLVGKGDLETVRRNGRKIEYAITKRGYMRWVRYTRTKLTEAFRCVTDVKKSIGKIIDKYFDKGFREFVLEGENDALAAIVGEVFRETIGGEAKLLWGPVKEGKKQVVLKLDGIEASTEEDVVYLLHELAKAE